MATHILADVGGTHARFALLANGQISKEQTFAASDYNSFRAALAAFRAAQDVPDNTSLAVATAAVPDEQGIWCFHNDNSWEIDPVTLTREGSPVALIVNDFVASARGVVSLPKDKLLTLRAGKPIASRASAVLGPGTGLGLAYTIRLAGGGWHVQPTHGGHMLASALTEEQKRIMELVRQIRGMDIIVPEDLVSGRGVPVLYHAVCQSRGSAPEEFGPAELIQNSKREDVSTCWRLFHEFLGLFAHQAVITGHAYGGLYLFGGLTDRLHEAGLLDLTSFIRFFELPVAPPVYRELQNTPIILVNDPYAALYGLKELLADAARLSHD